MERTLVLLKPDALQRGLAGRIITRLEDRGLKLVGLKLVHMSRETACRLYEVHEGKPFFEGLVKYMTSRPIIAAAVEGDEAVEVVRRTMGDTDPRSAAPGTIRGDLATAIGRNLVHGSDSADSAARELPIFFDPAEMVAYDRDVEPWLTES